MGIKLLVKKDRDKNEYRHYLQEYEMVHGENGVEILDDNLCPEHATYLVEYTNVTLAEIDYISYFTGTTELSFGKAGRIDVD